MQTLMVPELQNQVIRSHHASNQDTHHPNSRPKIIVNAFPRPEVIHERISRDLLILVRKRIHQIMDLTQISLFRRWHGLCNLSPTLGIAQARTSYQFHNLVRSLNCGNRPVQEFVDERCSPSLCLLDDVLAIGLFALRAGNQDPHILLVVSDSWIGLAAITLKFGAVMSAISLITIADLVFEPCKQLS